MVDQAGTGGGRARPREVDPVLLTALNYRELPQADFWLSWWLNTPAWHQEKLQMFGQWRQVPRLLAWFGDAGLNYRYSGADHVCTGWPPALSSLRSWTETTYGVPYNFVLANRYRNGQDSMGWHADDEPELLGDVCSISLGAARRFLIATPSGRCAMDLSHGQVIRIPRSWRHALPKTRRVVGERINLTFRQLRTVIPS